MDGTCSLWGNRACQKIVLGAREVDDSGNGYDISMYFIPGLMCDFKAAVQTLLDAVKAVLQPCMIDRFTNVPEMPLRRIEVANTRSSLPLLSCKTWIVNLCN